MACKELVHPCALMHGIGVAEGRTRCASISQHTHITLEGVTATAIPQCHRPAAGRPSAVEFVDYINLGP